MHTTRANAKKTIVRCILGLFLLLNGASESAARPTAVTLGTTLGTGVTGPVALASVMGGGEWAFDVPWRLEPPYDKLPLNLSIFDMADPKDPYDTAAADPNDGSAPHVDHVCDVFVVLARANGAPLSPNQKTFHYFPLASRGTHSQWRSGFEEAIGEKFHEIERSAKWPASSDRPAFHTLRRVWQGEAVTADDARISDTAEWHATALMDVSNFPPGDYVVTAVAYMALDE